MRDMNKLTRVMCYVGAIASAWDRLREDLLDCVPEGDSMLPSSETDLSPTMRSR